MSSNYNINNRGLTDTELRATPVPVLGTFSDSAHNHSVVKSLVTTTPTITGVYTMDKDNNSLLFSRVQGTGGAQSYSQGVNTMSVTTTAGSYAISQSFQRHPYYAGIPMLIEMTFNNFQLEAGIIKEVGYFQGSQTPPHNTGYDGFYFESNGVSNKYNFCVANANTSTITRIEQADWNLDTMDGNGASGITLDFSKFTAVAFEFIYLGGAAARMGFILDSGLYWVHNFTHANINVGTIIRSPQNPIRWSIRNVSGGSTGSMGQICASVQALGTVSNVAQFRGAFDIAGLSASRTSFINANSAGITYMLRAIRINPTAVNTCVLAVEPVAMSSTNDDLWISLLLNPTITGLVAGAATWESLTNSYIQYAYGDTVTTAGSGSTTQVTSQGANMFTIPLAAVAREPQKTILDVNRRPGISVDGVSRPIAVCVTPTNNGTNADVFGSLNFLEL